MWVPFSPLRSDLVFNFQEATLQNNVLWQSLCLAFPVLPYAPGGLTAPFPSHAPLFSVDFSHVSAFISYHVSPFLFFLSKTISAIGLVPAHYSPHAEFSSRWCFGTGHYLSPKVGWGGGRILGGVTWFLGEQKGGSLETFGRIQRGTTQVCLENEDMWGGGIAKVIKSYRGDHFSEVTFKRRIG